MFYLLFTHTITFFLLEMVYCVLMLFLSEDPIKMFGNPKITDIFPDAKEENFTNKQKYYYVMIIFLILITIVPIIEESICHYLLYPYFSASIVNILFVLAHPQYYTKPFNVYTGSIACGSVCLGRHLIGLNSSLLIKIILHSLQNIVSGTVLYQICPKLIKAITK